MKRLALLGSTGSIGVSACEVIAAHPERFTVDALAAGENVALLREQIARFRPSVAALRDEAKARQLRSMLSPAERTEVLFGPEGYRVCATLAGVDMVLSAMVGAAGLLPTLAAITAGKDIALANKEVLVMAGELVMAEARERNVKIMPVDSEHSAIFQCLAGHRSEDVRRIILTASGGPFLRLPGEDLAVVTPQQALQHPRWHMGPKITIDSATLMNKGFEVIEAAWLFGVESAHVAVLIHPQSIVHSLVEFLDGSVMAQLGMPDMRVPIGYALAYPERLTGPAAFLDLVAAGALQFEAPDFVHFPCLRMAYEAARSGGTVPAALNGANEIAVAAFLREEIRFAAIPMVIAEVLAAHGRTDAPALEDIMETDRWARHKAHQLIKEGKPC
jgi:1-deoxy-D-xylulose-5-phosphate reductoisomerase